MSLWDPLDWAALWLYQEAPFSTWTSAISNFARSKHLISSLNFKIADISQSEPSFSLHLLVSVYRQLEALVLLKPRVTQWAQYWSLWKFETPLKPWWISPYKLQNRDLPYLAPETEVREWSSRRRHSQATRCQTAHRMACLARLQEMRSREFLFEWKAALF